MISKEQLESLTELYKRVDFTVDAIDRNYEGDHREEFFELAKHVRDLCMHVKQLQYEVVKCQQTTSLT